MIDFLTKVPLFANLNTDQLASIGAICSKKSFKTGTILFQEKEPGSIFYIVYSGSVKVYTRAVTGEEKILSTFNAGDSFGELSLIDGKPRSASAQTLEDSVLITLAAQNFLGAPRQFRYFAGDHERTLRPVARYEPACARSHVP